MSSRHRHKRSHSRDSRKEASPSKRRKSSEKQDKLDAILASLTDLKSDISSCNARICEIEAKNAVFEAVFRNHPSPAEHAVEEDTDDQLSFVAVNEFNDDINEDAQALDTGTEPSHTVNKPPIKPPNKAIKPTNSPHAMSPVDGQIHTDESASVMFDPETQANSWSPSPVFHSFLEKQFRRKLSYEQVCDILEQQAIPAVDSLVAPTLDHSVINRMDNLHNRLTFDLGKKNKIFYYS